MALIAAAIAVSTPTASSGDGSKASDFNSLIPLSAGDLGQTRAGQDTVYAAVSEQSLTALNTGNSVNANVVNSGDVTLQSGAFSSFSGIGNFVINTGNNNNLQGSLNVTILMAPAAAVR
jgi:hypothetical protein